MRKRIVQLIIVTFCISLIINCAVAQEGKILRIRFHSTSLEKNLFNDSPDRDVTIYLPPSYDVDTDMRYPVVYLLHGYTGNDMLWTGGSYIRNGNIKDWMDMWLEEGKVKEMILVMPNSYNKFLGSFYRNSSATGNWADYIVKDLVAYIDTKYRTLPQRESRGVAGHSMGGGGSLFFGMSYPNIFSCIGVMAGTFSGEPSKDVEDASHLYAYISSIKDWNQFYSLSTDIKALFALCSVHVPNPEKPPFYCDFPYIYSDTEPTKIVKNEDAFNKLVEGDETYMVDSHINELKSLRAIYIDCGTNDFPTIYGSRVLHQKLTNYNIDHVYKEFVGNHICCVMNSTGDALEVFSKAMAFEMLTGVEPEGKLATTWGEIRRTK